jgi:hypothetical protein
MLSVKDKKAKCRTIKKKKQVRMKYRDQENIKDIVWGRDLPHPFRPTLGPTQPPIQLISFPGVNRQGTWKILKCGVGEGWRRSVGPIM